MKKFKIGIQLYSVRKAIAEDLEGTLRAVKAMGYDYVESAGVGFYGKTAEEAKALLDEIGLTLISVHTRDTSDENLTLLKALGVTSVAIPYHSADEFKNNWEQTVAFFKESAAQAKKYGMRLYYHNHDFEFTNTIGGEKIIDKLYRELGDIIAPQFDVCWVTYGGSEPAEYLHKYRDLKMFTTHIKDFTAKGAVKGAVYDLIEGGGAAKTKDENLFRYQPIGQGVVNFDKVIAACEEVGVDCLIVEQDDSYETPCLEAARQSREYLKKTYNI